MIEPMEIKPERMKMEKSGIDDLFDLFRERHSVFIPDQAFDEKFCELLLAASGAQEASIWEMGGDNRLSLKYGTNITTDELANFSFQPGEGISGAAVLSRRTVSVGDVSSDQQHNRHVDESIRFRTRSMISAPMIYGGNVLGVINILNHKSKNAFPRDWIHLMSAVSLLYSAALTETASGQAVKSANGTPQNRPPGQETVVVGVSPAIQDVLAMAMKAARSRVPVMIYGGTGTGKELAARRIHENMENKRGRFLSINCAALNETILESELFGHKKGAFSGASADRKGKFVAASGGTLFLDEIGEMSLSCQSKILRVLQEKKVMPVGSDNEIAFDARIITATNQNLESLIAEGRFRQDLYFRLCGLELHMPDLSERRSDIPLLIDYFIKKGLYGDRITTFGQTVPEISANALDLMMNYNWPGNVRQLEQAVSAALAVCDNRVIRLSDLPGWLQRSAAQKEIVKAPDSFQILDPGIENEKVRYIEALNKTRYKGTGRWNVSAAARLLQIPRKTFVYRIGRMKLRQHSLKENPLMTDKDRT